MLRIAAFGICASLAGGGVFAQLSGQLDATTQRPAAARLAVAPRPGLTPSPRPPGRVAVGGETIGYTTDNLIPHYYQLTALPQAAADLQADGHTLVPVDALTPANLAGLDRLVVGVVRDGQTLSSSQVDVIENFVLGGGKLVFLGENSAFRTNNIAVGGRFGIVYPAVGTEPPEIVLTNINPHPITLGPFGAVSVVDGSANNPTAFGSMASVGPNGTSLVDFPGGNSACAVIEPGALGPDSGLVVAYAEINIFQENYLNGDNRALWRNTFEYCPAPVTEPLTWVYSTGLFQQAAGSQSLDWAILNDTKEPQQVRVTVYRADLGAPKSAMPPGPLTVTIQPGETTHNANSYALGFSYEVQIEASVGRGLLMSVANWSAPVGSALIPGSQILTKDFLVRWRDGSETAPARSGSQEPPTVR